MANSPVDAYGLAVQQAQKDQNPALRYKGSILIVVSGVAAILAQLATSPDLQNSTLPMALTAAATIITMMVNRFTKDGMTPSMARRLQAAAVDYTHEGADYSDPTPEPGRRPAEPISLRISNGLPVYDGPTTGG